MASPEHGAQGQATPAGSPYGSPSGQQDPGLPGVFQQAAQVPQWNGNGPAEMAQLARMVAEAARAAAEAARAATQVNIGLRT